MSEQFITTEEIIKYKRQIRDHFNKTVSDKAILDRVAAIISYKRKKNRGKLFPVSNNNLMIQ